MPFSDNKPTPKCTTCHIVLPWYLFIRLWETQQTQTVPTTSVAPTPRSLTFIELNQRSRCYQQFKSPPSPPQKYNFLNTMFFFLIKYHFSINSYSKSFKKLSEFSVKDSWKASVFLPHSLFWIYFLVLTRTRRTRKINSFRNVDAEPAFILFVVHDVVFSEATCVVIGEFEQVHGGPTAFSEEASATR